MLDAILQFQDQYRTKDALIENLFHSKLDRLSGKLEDVWRVVASFEFVPTHNPALINFWLTLVAKLVAITPKNVPAGLWASIIHTSKRIFFVVFCYPELAEKALNAITGKKIEEATELIALPLAPFRPSFEKLLWFEQFKDVHHRSLPDLDTVVRRSMLCAMLVAGVKVKDIVKLNQDYYEMESPDLDFLFVKCVYEDMYCESVMDRGDDFVFKSDANGEDVFKALVAGPSKIVVDGEVGNNRCWDMVVAFVQEKEAGEEQPQQANLEIVEAMADRDAVFEGLCNFDAVKVEEKSRSNVCAYWIQKVNLWIEKYQSSDVVFIIEAMQVCKHVVDTFQKTEFQFLISGILEQKGIPECTKPELYPVSSFSRKLGRDVTLRMQAAFGEVQQLLDFRFDVRRMISRAVLFAALELGLKTCELINKANSEYTDDSLTADKLPDMDRSGVIDFCVLRYLYEQTFGKKLPRLFKKEEPKAKDSNIAGFVFTEYGQVPFEEDCDIQEFCLAVINDTIASPVNTPVITKKLWIFSIIKLALDEQELANWSKVLECKSELEALVCESRFRNSAAVVLLSRPECLDMLTDDCLNHRLLKIFLTPRGELVWDKLSLEPDLETTAEFFWRYRLPSKPEFCMDLLYVLMGLFRGAALARDGTSGYGFLKEAVIDIPTDPKAFFDSSRGKLDNIILMLSTVLKQLKEISSFESLDRVALSDLSIHSRVPREMKELIGAPIPERLDFWKRMQVVFSPSDGAITEVDSIFLLWALEFKAPTGCEMPMRGDLRSLVYVCLYLNDTLVDQVAKDWSFEVAVQLMWKFIVCKPHIGLRIFASLKIDQDNVAAVLQHIPANIDQDDISKELSSVCNVLSQYLPQFLFDDCSRTSAACHDETGNEKHVPDDAGNIWQERRVKRQCCRTAPDRQRVGYVCRTCGSSRGILCLSCAVNCHKGHDVGFGTFGEYDCECSRCSEPEGQPVPIQGLLTLFKVMAMGPEPEVENVPRVSSEQLREMECVKNSQLEEPQMRIVRTDTRILKCEKLEAFSQELRNLPDSISNGLGATVMHLVDSAGDLLFVLDRKYLKAFDLSNSFEKLAKYEFSGIPCHVRVKPDIEPHSAFVAVAGLNFVDVLKFDREARRIRRVWHKEPNVSHNNNITAVSWVQNRLAVVRRFSLVICDIDLTSGQVRSSEQFKHKKGKREAIMTVSFQNCGEEWFAIIALENGQIARERIFKVPASTKKKISDYFSWKLTYVGNHVSICPENNLAFVSIPGVTVGVHRLDSFEKAGPLTKLNIPESCGEWDYYCCYPGFNTLMLFVQYKSHALYTAEITSHGIEYAPVEIDAPAKNVMAHSWAVYGYFKFNDKIYALLVDGTVAVLTRKLAKTEALEYRVPLTFWSDTTVATKSNSQITGTDPSQNYNTLYVSSVAYFRKSTITRTLTFHINNPNDCIVGIMLWFGDHGRRERPEYVMLNNRKYMTKTNEHFLFPLMPQEVKPGASVSLHFPAPNSSCPEVTMQCAHFFTMPYEKVRPFVEAAQAVTYSSWPTSLLEFHNVESSEVNGLTHSLWRIARAIAPSSDVPVAEDILKTLARILYTDKQAAVPARYALVRLASTRQNILEIWIKTISELASNGPVDDDLWADFFRDCTAIGHEELCQFCDRLWERDPKLGSVGAVLCAFMSD